jgi:hypothetical protein
MKHRHLVESGWTLAAVDDVIARGRLEDWKALRQAAAAEARVREHILKVCAPRLADPTEQRYHFWDYYVRRHLA